MLYNSLKRHSFTGDVSTATFEDTYRLETTNERSFLYGLSHTYPATNPSFGVKGAFGQVSGV